MTSVEAAIAAIRDGRVVVIPTDTVYGLACTPHRAGAVRALSALKGRSPEQPIAIVAFSIETLVECVPELPEGAVARARRLLPGPYTLVLPNPACRFAWLSGGNPETIGVRVPSLTGPACDLLEAVVDGGDLPGTPSTVLDLTGPEPRVLREGAVPADEALSLAE